jgi:hypothetical protein
MKQIIVNQNLPKYKVKRVDNQVIENDPIESRGNLSRAMALQLIKEKIIFHKTLILEKSQQTGGQFTFTKMVDYLNFNLLI